ncbi:MAG: hypothetical protein WC708_06940 [Lentisphaeria bacterium]
MAVTEEKILESLLPGNFKKAIEHLLARDFLERTISDKPNSRLQKYRLLLIEQKAAKGAKEPPKPFSPSLPSVQKKTVGKSAAGATAAGVFVHGMGVFVHKMPAFLNAARRLAPLRY